MRIVPIWDPSIRPSSRVCGPTRWYRCLRCLSCVSSLPQINVACHCGNLGHDWDAWFYVRDKAHVEAIELEGDERPPAGINWEQPPSEQQLARLVAERPMDGPCRAMQSE